MEKDYSVISSGTIEKKSLPEADRSRIPKPPQGIKFEIRSIEFTSRTKIEAEGHLINETEEALDVFVFPVGGENPFYLELWKGEKLLLPKHSGLSLPQQEPPPPMLIHVPAKSIIEFKSGLDLSEYEYHPDEEIEVRWRFCFWSGKSPNGVFRLKKIRATGWQTSSEPP